MEAQPDSQNKRPLIYCARLRGPGSHTIISITYNFSERILLTRFRARSMTLRVMTHTQSLPLPTQRLSARLAALCFVALAGTGLSDAQASSISFNGTFSVTEAEKAKHKRSILSIAQFAKTCMQRDLKRHQDFYARYRISPFYGSNSKFGKMNQSEKMTYLRNRGLSNPESIYSQMEMTSCVGFAMKCFKEGFVATNQSELWERINRYAGQNNYDGSSIMNALRELGWYVMYWNPDTSQNQAWDEDEKERDSTNESRIWGYHDFRNIIVNRENRYYKNPIDDKTTLVDFGTRPPAVLRNAPLFWGIAHTGFHVFPGFHGHVIEAHSTRQLDDYQTIEEAAFNPLANGGAPRGRYRSGLIAVPPGYEPNGSGSSDSIWRDDRFTDITPDIIPGITPPVVTPDPAPAPGRSDRVCRIEMERRSGEYFVSIDGRMAGRRLFAGNRLRDALIHRDNLVRDGRCRLMDTAEKPMCDIRMVRQYDGVRYYVTRGGEPYSGLWRLMDVGHQMNMMHTAGECYAKPSHESVCRVTRDGRDYLVLRTDKRTGEKIPMSTHHWDTRYLEQWKRDIISQGICGAY